MIFAILAIVAIIIVIIIVKNSDSSSSNHTPSSHTPSSHIPWIFEPEEKRVGRQGERIATSIIQRVLREDDCLFTNVSVSFDGKPAELDNVIVNKYGVFIIEVKNYKGRLYGSEDDYEWKKYKDDDYGNTFEKDVKNPIKQVNRQTYILAKFLEYYGSRVWVEGYAFLIHGNSPVESKYVLENTADIDKAIHTFEKNRLSVQTVESIKKLLSSN